MEMSQEFEVISTEWCPVWSKLKNEDRFRDLILERIDKTERLDFEVLTHLLAGIFEIHPEMHDLVDEMERLNGEDSCNWWLCKVLEDQGWKIDGEGYVYAGHRQEK